ncbi:MAG: four helix bundle protein [Bacteroidota bacterium]
MIKSFLDLEVYQLSYTLAIDIFKISKSFPTSEKYSLTDQIVRSTRSISANIAEGFGRRIFPAEFKKFLVYSAGSLEETKVWLNFAKDCQYITTDQFDLIYSKADIVGAKIYKLYINWR